MADVGRPKKNDFPPYMTADGDRGGFVVRNPVTGKKTRFSASQEALARQTAERLGEWIQAKRRQEALDAGRPTVKQLVTRWREERLPLQPWDKSTRRTAEWRLGRIDEECGHRLLDDTDCLFLETWISQAAKNKADPFNKWRYIWVLLWRFAVGQKMAPTNEAQKVEPRSTSRKIEGNRKTRQQLDIDGFKAIHAQAPAWLQLAMELSLVTLQARKEICSIRHPDFRDGFLFVIRDKVAGDSAMAFIKIRLSAELEELQSRARKLDGIASPYLIHRKPERMQRRWVENKNKPHWAYVNEQYLSKAFAAARDQVERFAKLPERARPTFHEIRGLGARLYQERGMSKEAIQALMTHSDKKTTEIYLELGPQALRDEHFNAVAAPFTVKELLGADLR